MIAQESIEDRVAVEAWQAAPDHAALAVDEGGEPAVAYHSEIEARHDLASLSNCICPSKLVANDNSQLRKSSVPATRKPAVVSPPPIFMEIPPRRAISPKASSSVTSSPAKTGILPSKGSSCMNSAIASALVALPAFTSTTILPWRICT